MAKKISEKAPREYQRLEDVVGCKWSVAVLQSVRDGVRRPGELERHIAGISAKVLAERLRKLGAYGLIERFTYAESPPRTEYGLTAAGEQLVKIVEQIRELDAALDAE